MKKILLSIALAALSAGAYATNYGGGSGYDYTVSGVEARVGGGVSAYSGPANGYGRSSISMTSAAGAALLSNSYGYTHPEGYYTRRCYGWRFTQTGVGAHSGVSLTGGAFSLTKGHSTGDAYGYNFGEATYAGYGYSGYSMGGGNQYAGASSYADISGYAGTGLELVGNDWGFALVGTASGARNSSAAHANRPYYGGTEVDGRSHGKTWSVSGGLVFGSADGLAYSDAYQSGSAAAWTTDGWRRKDAYSDGSLYTSSYSDSVVFGTGLAGSWMKTGASFDGWAYDGRTADWAYASDHKYARGDSFRFGDADAVTWGGANVDAYSRAGEVVDFGNDI